MSKPVKMPPTPLGLLARRGPLIVLAVALVLAAGIRIRLLSMPLERDEGEYAYGGQLMLEGVPPYEGAANMKLPGTAMMYAATMAVFGQTPSGIHFGLLLVNLGGALMVFLLFRRLCGPWVGALAGGGYALMSTSPTVLGLAGHATHYVLLFSLAGLVVLLRALESGRRRTFFAAGVLLGLGILMKQSSAPFVLLALFTIAWDGWRTSPVAWGRLVARAGLLVGGAVLPLAALAAWLWAAGAFDAFVFWVFTYGWQYAARLPLDVGMQNLYQGIGGVMGPYVAVWILAGLGLIAVVADEKARRAAPMILGLTLFSLLATSAGLYWREHYFILMLPAVAGLAAVAVDVAARWAAEGRLPRAVQAVPALALAAALVYATVDQAEYLFRQTPDEACRARYWCNPFVESVEIGRYLRAHAAPDDRIAVLGSEPQIFFYAHRRSVSPVLYTYPLMEPHPYASEMQRDLIRAIETARPRYVVFVSNPLSWLAQPDSDQAILKWASGYFNTGYQRVGVIDMFSPAYTEYRWDAQTRGYRPRSPVFITVLRREDGE